MGAMAVAVSGPIGVSDGGETCLCAALELRVIRADPGVDDVGVHSTA